MHWLQSQIRKWGGENSFNFQRHLLKTFKINTGHFCTKPRIYILHMSVTWYKKKQYQDLQEMFKVTDAILHLTDQDDIGNRIFLLYHLAEFRSNVGYVILFYGTIYK